MNSLFDQNIYAFFLNILGMPFREACAMTSAKRGQIKAGPFSCQARHLFANIVVIFQLSLQKYKHDKSCPQNPNAAATIIVCRRKSQFDQIAA